MPTFKRKYYLDINVILCLEELEKQEQNKTNTSKIKEIIKIIVKIHEMEYRNPTVKINIMKRNFFEKINKTNIFVRMVIMERQKTQII